jgi:L-ascorbate metabolism protein UlaG (beta-lactamase superfamily)
MEISWLGHSCFKPAARIVTVSHQHAGHSYVQGISDGPKPVAGPGEYEISDVLIIGMPTFHDAEGGKKRGKNTVYLIEIEGVAICHLGDLGHVLATEQVEELENVDVLLLPVGGISTINAAMAAQVVRQLEPRVVIPMHYKTEALKWELESVEGFLKEMGVKQVESRPKLSLNKTNLPPNTQVFLLSY